MEQRLEAATVTPPVGTGARNLSEPIAFGVMVASSLSSKGTTGYPPFLASLVSPNCHFFGRGRPCLQGNSTLLLCD